LPIANTNGNRDAYSGNANTDADVYA